MPPQWSTDGNWFWDGGQWQDALSADGHWRFDGRAWQPFNGQRTPMPPPPGMEAAAAAYPTWLAHHEVTRLEEERVQREQAVQAAALAPPSATVAIDWSHVHADTIRRSSRRYQPAGSWWQVGVPSIVIYLALLLLCFPACGIYVRWGTRWSSGGKWIGYGALVVCYLFAIVLRVTANS